ncbi:hypothetical protein AB0J83_43555 [Actinoplanes sp. NPDC049596]|uniref:aromatic-ring hydroxylase C-terminal domain-containing protein n=1 Tax=unclassified Actinoplanes TaxID=2626549 RepID=UPI00342CBA4A
MPGHRAPDGYVDPWGDTLYDRIGHRFALLVLDGGAEAFRKEADARNLPFTVIHLPERRRFGAANVLIRPDQHVAWRGEDLPPGSAAAVLDKALGFTA